VVERPGGVLLVRRPDGDESLPGVWGLPAASLADGEYERDAVRRAGREKLGIEVRPLYPLGSELTMTDWLVEVVEGEPSVPQDGPNTQYTELRWGDPRELVPAARQGSLCSRALLRARGLSWEE
jgi:hypothetical protein